MNFYGAKELAATFRTVRKNTLTIAQEIPEENYTYRPCDGVRTVAELLTHIALGGKTQEEVILVQQLSSMASFDYMKFRAALTAEMNQPRSKAAIVALLKDEYAAAN